MDQYLQLDQKTRVHYAELGTGEPLILLPSLWTTSLSYERLGIELGKQYHVFIPDLNKTKSTFQKTIRTYDDFVEELHRFVTALHIKQFYLVGISQSGFYGAKYVRAYPQGVKKMFIVSSSVVGVDIPYKKIILAKGYIKLFSHNMTSRIGLKTNTLWLREAWLYFWRHPKQFIYEGLVATGDYGKQPLSLPVSSKLLFATRDEFIPHFLLDQMKKVKNLQTEVIDGYHCWFFFHESVLVDKIVSFFG
jgi:pimeloyl-ACP methyl ester carboxylesterase